MPTSQSDTGRPAKRDQEIEVKYRVKNAEAVIAAFAARGVVFSPAVHQDDQAYAPAGWNYDQPKIGVPFARLRSQQGRHLFTVKQPVDNEMACLEYESEVSDRAQMHAALLAMGFRPTVRIVKTRRQGTCEQLSLCLDEVEHAGTFLEIEEMVPAGESGEFTQARLDSYVRSLGLAVQRTTQTYDSLIRLALSSV